MPGNRFLPVTIVLVILLALSAGLSAAQGPAPQDAGPLQTMLGSAFTYQGQLQKDGTLVNDTCTMVFSLYDDATAGSQQGDPITLTVTVADGLFTAVLNSNGEFGTDAFTGEARWLEVAVQCTGDASFNTLAPRQALTAAPYALSLRPGALVEGDIVSGHVLRAINRGEGSGLFGRSDGTSNAHGVTGLASATSGTTYGVYGRSSSPDGYGVFGWNGADTGTADGVYGRSDSQAGCGVYGWASATRGDTHGVYGRADSTVGSGVLGYASATSGPSMGVMGRTESPDGYGVVGYATATSGGNYGVYGHTDSTAGTGVSGYAPATSGGTIGVGGQVNSPDGYAVYGVATAAGGRGVTGYAPATSGGTFGVTGQVNSPNGRGVYGYASATTGHAYGVYGIARSTDGIGVAGYASATGGATIGVTGQVDSPDGIAVYGFSTATSGSAYGVVGLTNSPQGYGVYSFGNFGATGTKAAIVPTQAYGWRHLYSVESPDVLFEDVGTAQLVDGQAVVTIDPIFAQTVNLEQPYQVFLTALGQEPVLLFVSAQTGTSFTVQGVTLAGRPGTCAFHYRIIAKRLGYEGVRLAPAQDPARSLKAAEPLPK